VVVPIQDRSRKWVCVDRRRKKRTGGVEEWIVSKVERRFL
jgi:hypothetical protein